MLKIVESLGTFLLELEPEPEPAKKTGAGNKHTGSVTLISEKEGALFDQTSGPLLPHTSGGEACIHSETGRTVSSIQGR